MRKLQLILALCLAAVCVEAEEKPDGTKAAGDNSQVGNFRSNRMQMQNTIIMDRLRGHPKPGQFLNGPLDAKLTDVLGLTGDIRGKMDQVSSDYDMALFQKAQQWEKDLIAMRKEYEANMLKNAPEEKREALAKALEYSHAQWRAATDLEAVAKVRAAIAPRGRGLESPDGSKRPADAIQVEMETLEKLPTMLAADDAARLEKMKRPKDAAGTTVKGGASGIGQNPGK